MPFSTRRAENVICIYVSIGQKASSLAKIITTLHNADAMKYTCVVLLHGG